MEIMPLSLDNNKLIETIFEIKFNEQEHVEVLFTTIYNLLNNDGFIYTKLPHADLPPQIIEQEKSLEFIPFYRFTKNNLNILLGPKIIGFSMTAPYSNWSSFKSFIEKNLLIFDNIFSNRTIQKISMRYINFFENENIFDNINISVNDDFLCEKYTTMRKRNYRTSLECNNYELMLQIDNSVSINKELVVDLLEEGSIVDINLLSKTSISKDVITAELDNIHKKIKAIFFKTIKLDYINKKLNPIYE